MGLMSGLMGNASEISLDKIREEFEPMIIDGEALVKAFKVIRDLYVFTNKRMILVGKHGVSGKKAEYLSIPYRSIVKFAKESTGLMDLEAKLKIWIYGQPEPLIKEFKNDRSVNEIYLLLSKYILR